MKPFNIPLKTRGRFRLTTKKADGSLSSKTGWCENLFTNHGKDAIFTAGVVSNAYLAVGTGNTTPAVTDTVLVSEAATSPDTGYFVTKGNSGSAPYYGFYRRGYTFPIGSFTDNTNLAELGVRSGASGDLRTRALIVDSGGSPTTFTVHSDEQLEVEYEYRLYAPTVDTTGTVTNDADGTTTHGYTVRAENVNGSWNDFSIRLTYVNSGYLASGTLAAITGAPSGKVTKTIGSDQSGYVNGTFQLEYTFSFPTGQGNVAGGSVNSLGFSMGNCYFQVGLDTPFTKDNTRVASFKAVVSVDNY